MSTIPPPNHMSFGCPHCQVGLSLHPSQAGEIATCPNCGGKFQAPLPTAHGAGEERVQMDASSSIQWQSFVEKKTAAGICGIALGGLGVHKFILGMTTPAIIMLTVWLVGFLSGMCLIFPLLLSTIMSIIGMIEGVMYLTMTDDDFVQNYGVNRKEWF